MDLSQIGSFLPIIILFVALYFIMIRPQMKRQKEHQALVTGLAEGDEIVTNAGIFGIVDKINGQIIELKIANQTTIQIQKQAIVQVLPKDTIQLN